MDKNKQFTNTNHPVGATIHPERPAFDLSKVDLGSDFTRDVDPNAPAEAPVKEPPPKNAAVAARPVVSKAPDIAPAANLAAQLDNSGPSPPRPSSKGTGFASHDGWRHWLQPLPLTLLGGAVLGVVLISFLMTRLFGTQVQMIGSTSQADKATLFIDTKTHSVGVASPTNPSGLQVGSKVSAAPQGSANIRLGLVNGTDPSIFFEDNQKNSWQVLSAGGSVQFIQGTQVRAKLDSNGLAVNNGLNVAGGTTLTGGLGVAGNTTLGSAASNSLTIQGSTVAVPNNLNFSNNTFFIDAGKGTVAVGAASSSGYKLLVNGTIKANSSISSDGQILAAAGSPKNPGFSFSNNNNTGLYQVGLNVIGVAAGGNQILQVQPGAVFTVNGANIEADGYLRAGRGASNPTFQIARFTGTLDGSGSAVVNDGMSTGYNRALLVQGFYRGNSGEAVSLNVDYVNSGNFQISGGIPNRPFRVSMMYSQDGAGW